MYPPPRRAIWGHFGPLLGVFRAFSGHLRLLDAILDDLLPQGPARGIKVRSNTCILGFPGQFLAVFWAVLAFWGIWRLCGALLGSVWPFVPCGNCCQVPEFGALVWLGD